MLLKRLVHRQWNGDPAPIAFPSGHVAVATAAAMTAVLVLRVMPVAPSARRAAAPPGRRLRAGGRRGAPGGDRAPADGCPGRRRHRAGGDPRRGVGDHGVVAGWLMCGRARLRAVRAASSRSTTARPPPRRPEPVVGGLQPGERFGSSAERRSSRRSTPITPIAACRSTGRCCPDRREEGVRTAPPPLPARHLPVLGRRLERVE